MKQKNWRFKPVISLCFAVILLITAMPMVNSNYNDMHNILVSKGNNPPNTPTCPTGPPVLPVGTYGEFCTSSTDPDNDKVQIRFDWGDGEISDWSALVDSGEIVCLGHTWNSPGLYTLKAQARDEWGATSDWSCGLTVEVTENIDPNRPRKPTGPTILYVGVNGEYCTNATDPDNDKVQIRFDWDDGEISNWSDLVDPGTDVCMDHSWSDTGTYKVVAQARDEHGARSSWSWQLTVEVYPNTIPNTPNKPSGTTNLETGESGKYCTNATDPDGGMIRFRFDWDANGSHDYSDWTDFVDSGTEVCMDHSWSSSGTYIIKAQAKDEPGAASNWSEGITVFVNSAPEAPIINGPTGGKAGVSYNYDFNAIDPDGDNVSYYIYWGDGDITDWTAFQSSGFPGYSESHTWSEQDEYTIEAKAKDTFGAESEWATLTVTMSRNKIVTYSFFLQLFDLLPNLLPILQKLSLHRLAV